MFLEYMGFLLSKVQENKEYQKIAANHGSEKMEEYEDIGKDEEETGACLF